MDSLVLISKTWFMGLLILLALQYFVFLYAYRKKRIDIIDVFWGLSFIVVSIVYVVTNSSNINIATVSALICITVWGLRLSSHIYARFRRQNVQDKRYTDITKSFINNPFIVYIKVFAVQAFLASIITIVFLVATLSADYNLYIAIVGFVLWIFAFMFESVADMQLKKHISQKTGKLMNTGLWKYSRHPNYFGELVQWWGVWLIVSGGKFAFVGLIGPILISVLIVFVSGIPPLERHMASKAGWSEYKKSTSAIVPWFNFK